MSIQKRPIPKHIFEKLIERGRWRCKNGRTPEEEYNVYLAMHNFKLANDFTCEKCGYRGKHITVHHIEHQADRPDLAADENNFQLLCPECHIKEHKKK
jgi:5-methylcytosine-specific restriction endonuclease McrA